MMGLVNTELLLSKEVLKGLYHYGRHSDSHYG